VSDFLRALLGLEPEGRPAPAALEPRLVAAAALMVEAARLDGEFSEGERQRILRLLTGRFGLPPEAAERLLAAGEDEAASSVDLHGFTSAIKDGFDHEGRVALLEMLWAVVYADGRLHDYEASLMRRVAGLLYVSGSESAEARDRALARLAWT
jgi:uncharacterized tellurite resistance protein B-like protein